MKIFSHCRMMFWVLKNRPKTAHHWEDISLLLGISKRAVAYLKQWRQNTLKRKVKNANRWLTLNYETIWHCKFIHNCPNAQFRLFLLIRHSCCCFYDFYVFAVNNDNCYIFKITHIPVKSVSALKSVSQKSHFGIVISGFIKIDDRRPN